MTITDAELKRAESRMTKVVRDTPCAIEAHFDVDRSRVVVSLESGVELSFSPHLAQGLENAKPEDMDVIEVSPTGLGLHFPKLDADLYIPALLSGFMGSKVWMAAQMGRIGGTVKTEAKAISSRENGKLGGRPRKAA